MKSPFAYIGGKSRLAQAIIERIPEHVTYVEPFSGGARVFFEKPRSKVEVLNDLDSRLVNFYRVCQCHCEELIRSMRFMPISREWFEDFEGSTPKSLTDIQRAARFLYLQKLSYAGRASKRVYGVRVIQKHSMNQELISKLLSDAHSRLAGVQIEHLPYDQLIRRYDRSSTLFYLDPPYYGFQYYKYNFEPKDFVRMAELLRTIKGKFILSLNDHPQVRKLFSSFTVETVSVSYSLQRIAGKRPQELLIRNFK
jgi:DNA adenine methylase